MRSCSNLFILAVAAAAIVAAAAAGAWQPVVGKDPHIQELGKWAVEQSGLHVRFDRVVDGRMQRHHYYIHYELDIGVGEFGQARYTAVVYDSVFGYYRKLISFRRSRQNARTRQPATN